MKSILHFSSALVSLAALSPFAAQAASVSLDFSTDQYSGNFVELITPSAIGYNAQNVLYNPGSTNATAVARYDTAPGNSAYDDATFLTETVNADFAFPTLATAQSAGLYTRIQTSGVASGLGILGLLNKTNGDSVQLRLFYGAETMGVLPGTAFYNATFNLVTGVVTTSTGVGGIGSTNTFAAGSPITFSLAQTSGVDPTFTFSLSDAEGLIASTGVQTLTASEDYNGAGAIGARFNSASAGAQITFDNFNAVPEPSTVLISALGALALLRRRR